MWSYGPLDCAAAVSGNVLVLAGVSNLLFQQEICAYPALMVAHLISLTAAQVVMTCHLPSTPAFQWAGSF